MTSTVPIDLFQVQLDAVISTIAGTSSFVTFPFLLVHSFGPGRHLLIETDAHGCRRTYLALDKPASERRRVRMLQGIGLALAAGTFSVMMYAAFGYRMTLTTTVSVENPVKPKTGHATATSRPRRSTSAHPRTTASAASTASPSPRPTDTAGQRKVSVSGPATGDLSPSWLPFAALIISAAAAAGSVAAGAGAWRRRPGD